MIFRLHGKMNGKRIELDKDPGLPADCPVNVHLETIPLSIEERRRRIEQSCGVWKDDDAIPVIFEEIFSARRTAKPRDHKLNGSS